MKLLINKFALFCAFVLFCGQAFAQTNSPEIFLRCSYDSDKLRQAGFITLPYNFFPWGVCFHKPSFFRQLEGASTTSGLENEWTRFAIKRWNIEYYNYRYNKWPDPINYSGIPLNDLFVESCDRSSYNIIYTVKADLPGDAGGRYIPVDNKNDDRTFYSIIAMDTINKDRTPRKWTRELFINIMIHELGHALGLPHAQSKEQSHLMLARGFGCKNYDKNICKFKSYDFETLLAIYDMEILPPQPENFLEYCVSVNWQNWRCF